MIDYNLPYNCNNSQLLQAMFSDKQDLELLIKLNQSESSLEKHLKVLFSTIYNRKETISYIKKITSGSSPEEWLGHLINSLHYDPQMDSNPGDNYIFLNIDTYGSTTIHCKEFTIMDA